MRKLWLTGISAAILVGVGLWALFARGGPSYPPPPDIKTTPPRQIIQYIGSDDFNLMPDAKRDEYVHGFIGKLEESEITELGFFMFQLPVSEREGAFNNIKRMSGHYRVAYRLYQLFLEKLYAASPIVRQGIIMAAAVYQAGDIKDHPARFFLPNKAEFKDQFAGYAKNQSPRLQALSMQFLMDVKRVRDKFGLADPFD